jgi:acetyl esterase/lipase
MKIRTAILCCLLLIPACTVTRPKVVRLYSGDASDSKTLPHQEKEYFSPIINTQVVTNVSQPTLTAYLPEEGTTNGAAVIICPGGGFRFLSINSEGIDVAKWLNRKGVVAFVLKYRLVPTGDDGVKEMIAGMSDRGKMDASSAAFVPLAIADGLAAVSYVRQHATEFGVSPNRIGLMGFSAGGAVAASVAFQHSPESRPDFVAPIYAYMSVVREMAVPGDAPPMFIAAATDDRFGLATDSVTLYSKWVAAGKPAEVHIYAKGGHGFGMRKQNLPVDGWIERFGEWLKVQGFMTARQ